MRLFFCDADGWQVLDQNLRFDLQLSCQFIYTNLIRICHSPLCLLPSRHSWLRCYIRQALRLVFRFTNLRFANLFRRLFGSLIHLLRFDGHVRGSRVSLAARLG